MAIKLTKTKAAVTAAATLAIAGALALTGCSAGSDASDSAAQEGGEAIRVAATPSPHAEILNDAVKPLLEQEGYTLEVVEFNDYVQPNTVTESGEVDANYFQHRSYLETFNEENGTHLVEAAPVHYEPFGLYAGKTADLADLADGATVAVPNDTTNEARALLLLEQEGLLTLRDGAGITATVQDIEENPLNLEIVEVEAATLPRVLDDVDIAAINGNYAIEAGLKASDALAVEAATSDAAQVYTNVLVVLDGNESNEKIQALVKALQSDEVRNYINETYDGAVVATF